MNCEYHKNFEANFICSDCGINMCKACAVNDNGRVICIECAKKKGLSIIKNAAYESKFHNDNIDSNYSNPNKRYSKFWSIIFSFMPGGGHMYLGVMKRGLQFMLAFFGIIALANFFYSSEFLIFFSIVIWFYSFFDCFHIRKKLEQGEEINEDLIFPVDFKNINSRHLGVGLLVVGGLILLNEFFDQLIYITNRMNINSEAIRVTIRMLRNSFFPIVLIVTGFLILRKSNKKNIE
ncbi:hypothetical protein SAMN05660462_02587 [Proteiniborus ethanoligenes]|uniref:B box-type domain-containing protein n=1 Tax=Proteiniborus ethanoligenes TaxID=415015 RepID=A0A1H3RVL5_9FIRM|nr:B-box zinc finger protein [Proteiniborus ethanoligenes]TAH62912.1 MAG: hypothetical protein EWM50_04495 [Gottschalkiaceae bacterium]SDZ29763.1 hypothetical protein SAMN05660462_02587 [Proteiniborus ethanoligenes]